jgi:hypothetical protein
MKADRETTEADSAELGSVAVHREVPKEDVIVKPVGGRKKRHRGRNLAADRRQSPKDGPRKKLAASGKKMTRLARVVWRKERSREGPSVEHGRRKNQTRNKFARGTRNGWTPGRRQLMRQEGTGGTRNRDFKEQLRLGSERTTSGIYRKTIGLEILTRAVGISSGLRKMMDWTL